MPSTLTAAALPKVGTWEEQNLIYDFGGGWKVVEDRTPNDVTQVGTITRNCIKAPTWHPKLLPAPEDEAGEREARVRAQWDNETNRDLRGQAWIEQMIESAIKVPPSKRSYKILHLEDDDRRPYCGIIMGLTEHVDARSCTYSTYRDLGQETSVELDGMKFKLLQATQGIAWCPPIAYELLPTWWKASSDGEWDQAACDLKQKGYDIYTRGYTDFIGASAEKLKASLNI